MPTSASIPRSRQQGKNRTSAAAAVDGNDHDDDFLQQELREKKYRHPRSRCWYYFSSNNKRHPVSIIIIVVICLFGVLQTIFSVWNHTYSTDQKKQTDSNYLLSSLPPACTFQQLYDAFPPIAAKRKGNMQTTRTRNGGCWKLQDEIVRIPADTIVNRNHLQSLGNGAISGVYRAVLQIPNNENNNNQHQNSTSPCSAAIKTDHCHSWWPLGLKYQRSRSCAETNSYLWAPRSYMGAEYTGALVWYAQYQQNQSVPGLIPTWAIIVRDDSQTITTSSWWWRRRRRRRPQHLDRYPHPDPSVLGVLMPLVCMRTASDIIQEYHTTVTTTATGRLWNTSQQLARALLPAAQGLAFVGNMGLAFRDLLPKNVGFVTSTGEAVVYDHSYVGVKPIEDCHHVSCQFCPEENVFPKFDDRLHREIKRIPAGHDYIVGDLHNFRKVIVTLCKTTCLDTTRADRMAINVSEVQTIHNLIQILQFYATVVNE
jgi:hypothetical protein